MTALPNSSADLHARALALPKVLLHEHLDGSLREQTLLDLLAARGLDAPAEDAASLARWFDANANAGSLERYLEAFGLTVAAMASPAAMKRVAFEAAEDARAQGALLAEFRIAPLLFEPFGLRGDAVVEALIDGLAMSTLPTGLIVSAMRHEPSAHTTRVAALAQAWHARGGRGACAGVVAFDLAGGEYGHPPADHAAALALCRQMSLPLTLHAGEADIAERVVEAGRLGATRIGHGVRLVDALHDPARRHLVDEVKAMGLHLEVCPTSNVHTGAATSIATHPITALWNAGVSLSYHTDNTLMSRISHSHEALVLLEHTPLAEHDLLAMALQAAQASFLPAAQRARAANTIRAAMAR